MEQKILDQIAKKNKYNDWFHLTEENDPNSIHEFTLEAIKQALNVNNVSNLLPTEDHIKTVAEKKALKHAFANEYKYEEIKNAIIEGANFVKEQINKQ